MNDPRIRGKVSKEDVNKTAQLTWNAFVELLIGTTYDQLEPVQQLAYLVFWYDTEVKNGGHLQYFQHRGTAQLDETLLALERIGAAAQRVVLIKAAQSRLVDHAKAISRADVATQNGAVDLDSLDSEFHACQPELPLLLEAYLQQNFEAFIECED